MESARASSPSPPASRSAKGTMPSASWMWCLTSTTPSPSSGDGSASSAGSGARCATVQRALRDEGTSYHYQPSAEFSTAPIDMLSVVAGAFDTLRVPVERGATWTTDAPFRETAETVEAMRSRGLLAVEMEAAALYAFAAAREKPVLCFAHVTNQMAQAHSDFEKGEADGTVDALVVILAAAKRFAAKGGETS